MPIDYSTSIYPGTGQTKTAVDSGQHTRHYASDGSSPTWDWECTGVSWQDYEATCVQNIPADELSIKCYGPGHSDGNCCWYIFEIDNGGQTGLGHETRNGMIILILTQPNIVYPVLT